MGRSMVQPAEKQLKICLIILNVYYNLNLILSLDF